jgi:beta-glucosidase/6-phospho-beta-glucosidase/beta-galactosidase
MTEKFAPATFTWLAGIEDTCVHPPAGGAMSELDEYALTGHDAQWRADLDAVAELGATGLRYGVQWPRVHVAPGRFEWGWLDERLEHAAGTLGLTVVADLVHYGAPRWLPRSFADPAYPDAVAELAGAFAERYRGLVDHVTPLNEPITTASFCGLRGVWPPALTGWRGWVTVILGIVRGMRASIAAARAANPDVVIVHVEASAIYQAEHASLRPRAEHLAAVAALPTDLLLGHVDAEHPLHAWLLEHGATPDELAALTVGVPVVDVLGLNYYPDLTPRLLVDRGDDVQQVAFDRWTAGLEDVLHRAAARWRLPIVVTETSIEGDADRRADWMTASAQTVRRLAADGLDLRGYTWWPLVDFVDWSFASDGREIEEFVLAGGAPTGDRTRPRDGWFGDVSAGRPAFLRRMGLLSVTEEPDGTMRREATRAAAAFAAQARR